MSVVSIKNRTNEDKKPKITIVWGTDKEKTNTYVFENETQKAFFMKGVYESNGWLEYEVVKQGHETISYEQTSKPK
jgi:hypothetical protein